MFQQIEAVIDEDLKDLKTEEREKEEKGNYMFQLGLIIGGGTAQIQKNIIAERGLEMPREPKLAKSAAVEQATKVASGYEKGAA